MHQVHYVGKGVVGSWLAVHQPPWRTLIKPRGLNSAVRNLFKMQLISVSRIGDDRGVFDWNYRLVPPSLGQVDVQGG